MFSVSGVRIRGFATQLRHIPKLDLVGGAWGKELSDLVMISRSRMSPLSPQPVWPGFKASGLQGFGLAGFLGLSALRGSGSCGCGWRGSHPLEATRPGSEAFGPKGALEEGVMSGTRKVGHGGEGSGVEDACGLLAQRLL